jgi:NADH:ubiquinone oxidoreductase subunit 6 (subunit J)
VSNPALFTIAFYVLAMGTLGAALMVVTMRNIVRAAIALIFTFFLVSWIYLLMGADLLWAAQLLIYAGAIPVLIVFAIMLTRRSMSDTSNADTSNRPWASLVAIVFFIMLVLVLLPTTWHTADWPNLVGTTAILGKQLVTTYVVPFELVSVLLLVGLIGAVVLAHREEED